MPQLLLTLLAAMLVLCAVFALLYRHTQIGWMLPCAISFGTIAYHFLIRFLSPLILNCLFHKRYSYRSCWFQQKRWEPKLYRFLRVKDWKKHVPAYDPSEFSLKTHAPEEIIRNMCHAELVHELIVLLSFSSLLLAIPFGAFPVFLITAILAAIFDLSFVILQRYNRLRLAAILEKRSR